MALTGLILEYRCNLLTDLAALSLDGEICPTWSLLRPEAVLLKNTIVSMFSWSNRNTVLMVCYS